MDGHDLRTNQQKHLREEYVKLRESGCTRFDFMGGRRSGKTYFILQRLLWQVRQGCVVSVATMTDTQGRLGAYQDAKDIISGSPSLYPLLGIRENVRTIYNKYNGGRMFFKSYQSGERAKGIACDYLYINEANNFTEQQYTDLAMSVRKSIFADRNPNTKCWTEKNGFGLIHSTWQDNREHLTPAQIEEFEKLKRKAENPDATSADIAFYRMYYLGEYAEIYGDVFTPANIIRERINHARLFNFAIIADPSNLTGADYFASVCVATDGARMYVLDALSINTTDAPQEVVASNWEEWCKRWSVVLDKWREWVMLYDVRMIFCESNGVGAEFLRYARSAEWEIKPFAAKGNKHRRIIDNYNNLTSRVVWNETPSVDEYLQQVYTYTGKDTEGEHDDNIDCANSAFNIFYRETRFMQQ